MKVVEFRLHAMHDGERVYGTAVVEQRTSSGWREVKRVDLSSNDPMRRLWFEIGQRLVIEGDSDVEIVMDPQQNVATQRRRDMSLNEALKAEREHIADMQAAEDKRRQLEALREADERSKRDAPNA